MFISKENEKSITLNFESIFEKNFFSKNLNFDLFFISFFPKSYQVYIGPAIGSYIDINKKYNFKKSNGKIIFYEDLQNGFILIPKKNGGGFFVKGKNRKEIFKMFATKNNYKFTFDFIEKENLWYSNFMKIKSN